MSGAKVKDTLDEATETEEKLKTPSMYKVLLLNDDYTPMEFVVHILKKFFHKDDVTAQEIMLRVHHQGFGIAGVFTYEVAETKMNQVNGYAQKNHHPLKCQLEKE